MNKFLSGGLNASNIELEKFVREKDFPGKLIFAKVWGSRSHNTQVEGSDWDFSGVYVDDTRKYLGMQFSIESVQNKEGNKPDYSFYEVGHFGRLLIKGNPGIIEMLFTKNMMRASAAWMNLLHKRKLFLSKKCVLQYLGYADGQLKRYESGKKVHTTGGESNEKWLYHLTRVLFDAKRIVTGGEPLVMKKDKELEHLMKIRCSEFADEDAVKKAKQMYSEIEDILERCNLPESGDENFLNEWLVELRLGLLKS